MKKHFTAAIALALAMSLSVNASAGGYTAHDIPAEEGTEAAAAAVISETETAGAAEVSPEEEPAPIPENGTPDITETPETPEADEPDGTDEESQEQTDNGIPIYLDGSRMEFGIPAVMHESTTYVPIRAFCMAMGAQSVTWDAETLTAIVDAGSFTIEATCDSRYIVANERCLFVPHGNILIGGTFYVPVRPLAAAFDAAVTWDAETGSVHVSSGSGRIVSGDEFYDSTDLKWLAHIINAEARGECLDGKIAVGNVVLNRVESDLFPDTVYGVVFDGIQFTPVLNGSIYLTPSAESWIAAKLALEGADIVGESLFFAQASLNCWASNCRPFYSTIGGHSFYL